MEILSDVLKVDCTYQFEGEIKENYNWSGFLVVDFNNALSEQNNSTLLSLEGLSVDKSDTQRSTEIHKRYVLGEGGINQATNKVSFSVFPGNRAPFDYVVQYDDEDNCFYGAWYYVNNYDFKTMLGGYVKLSISAEFEKSRRNLENDINKWSMSKYYAQYLKAISYLIEEQRATIANHDDFDESIFKEASDYFKKVKKDKILKLVPQTY